MPAGGEQHRIARHAPTLWLMVMGERALRARRHAQAATVAACSVYGQLLVVEHPGVVRTGGNAAIARCDLDMRVHTAFGMQRRQPRMAFGVYAVVSVVDGHSGQCVQDPDHHDGAVPGT